jgi:hypothetical protein
MNRRKRHEEARCNDCGVITTPRPPEDGNWEWYMVTDEIWAEAGMSDYNSGFLCIGCLEQRLGRTLTRDDFHKSSGINFSSALASPRLQDRWGRRR